MNKLYKLKLRNLSFYEHATSNKHVNELFWMHKAHSCLKLLYLEFLKNPALENSYDISSLDEIIQLSKDKNLKELKENLQHTGLVDFSKTTQSTKAHEQYKFKMLFYQDLFKKNNKTYNLLDVKVENLKEIKSFIYSNKFKDYNDYIIEINDFKYFPFNKGFYSLETESIWIFNEEEHCLCFSIKDLRLQQYFILKDISIVHKILYNKEYPRFDLIPKLSEKIIVKINESNENIFEDINTKDISDEELLDLIKMKYEI